MFPLFKKDDKTTVKFVFDGDQVTWQDLKIIGRIQAANASPEDVQLLMAHFLVDEKNQYMSEERAVKMLDKLKSKEIQEVTAKFLEAIQEASIPKATGVSSNSPSDPGLPPKSPNGSEA